MLMVVAIGIQNSISDANYEFIQVTDRKKERRRRGYRESDTERKRERT